ncbi:hypothetical protein QUB63_17345 [Microcoleus sp. ARI1-B5]|uniref:DUF6745 domain-containing protein n=1 Tax=unclassified Microcoleus TaxID=2642155 RepID=UPI002FD086CE
MLPTDLLPKAQQIIDRLAAIDYENPKICEQRIRDAFSQHLIALNLHDRFVEIYHSLFDAFDVAWESTFDAEWQAAIEAAEKAVSDAAFEAASQAASDATNNFMSDVAMEAARQAAFDVASAGASDAPHFGAVKVAWSSAFETAEKAASDAAFRAVNKTASDRLWNAAWNDGFKVVFYKAWGDATDAVKKAANGAALRTGWGEAWNATFRAGWKAWSDYASDRAFKYALEAVSHTILSAYIAARDRARNAAIEAAFDGDWNVVRGTAKDTETVVEMAVESVNCTSGSPQHDRLCAVWMPLVDGVEAGLFCFWVTTTKVIALTLPVMRIENNGLHRLHADGQPAVQWLDWECYYFWRGTQIPQKYGAVLSREWRSQWLLEEPNAELRRVLIQGIGYDRIVQDLEAVELDTWREYSLLKIQADIDDEPIHLLKMTCPSTNHIHVLRTPPDITSAREAIAWCNWDIDPEQFSVES